MTPADEQRDPRAAALAWFARLRAEDAGEAERRAYRDWLAADPAHRRAVEELERVWMDLDRLGDPRERRATVPVVARPAPSRRRLLAGGAALAASAAAVALTGLPRLLTEDFSTGTGEFASLALSDGSEVELDAGSALSLDYSAAERRVALLRGRAFFSIAEDPARRFVVEAGDSEVLALGTGFVVHRWRRGATVAVLESSVRVTGPRGAEVEVGPGQRVTTGATGLGAVVDSRVEDETAWRRGRLIFVDQPLGRVVEDVNRYRPGRLFTTDAALDGLRISGVFDVSRPDGILDAIRRTLPVRTLELTPFLVLLRPA